MTTTTGLAPVTRSTLADGRDLLYFDDSGTTRRVPVPDNRDLPQRGEPGELRYDALSGEWVAVAAHRQSRTHLPPAETCPLCPTSPSFASEVPAPDYDVVVFENRFPSLGPLSAELPDSLPWGQSVPASGRCEVVSFTSDHTGAFSSLLSSRVRTVIEAWAHRTAELSALPGIRQVFPFENRGAQIGVTLHHPHGQIYAYPYLTPRAARIAEQAQRHYEARGTGQTLLGTLVDRERSDGSRMVLEGKHFSVYVPFAARWPIEAHLVPHRGVADFADLTGAEKDELAELYPRLLGGIDRLYDSATPYIAAWFQAPLDPVLRPASRLHLQLTSPRRAEDKLKYLAGSEAAMGAFINDTRAEDVAVGLRAAIAGACR